MLRHQNIRQKKGGQAIKVGGAGPPLAPALGSAYFTENLQSTKRHKIRCAAVLYFSLSL